jgi:hypothetical protein
MRQRASALWPRVIPMGARVDTASGALADNARMTLTELRYIVAVARERHFGRAAEACFVSQPTLSVAIKKLEEELDLKIFERAQRHWARRSCSRRSKCSRTPPRSSRLRGAARIRWPAR